MAGVFVPDLLEDLSMLWGRIWGVGPGAEGAEGQGVSNLSHMDCILLEHGLLTGASTSHCL